MADLKFDSAAARTAAANACRIMADLVKECQETMAALETLENHWQSPANEKARALYSVCKINETQLTVLMFQYINSFVANKVIENYETVERANVKIGSGIK